MRPLDVRLFAVVVVVVGRRLDCRCALPHTYTNILYFNSIHVYTVH